MGASGTSFSGEIIRPTFQDLDRIDGTQQTLVSTGFAPVRAVSLTVTSGTVRVEILGAGVVENVEAGVSLSWEAQDDDLLNFDMRFTGLSNNTRAYITSIQTQ